MSYLHKFIPASVAGAVAGIAVAVVLGPSAGTTAAAEVSRRWMQGQ